MAFHNFCVICHVYPSPSLERRLNLFLLLETWPGVNIDQTLNYNEHISKLVSSRVHKLVQINRIKHLLDRKTLLLMINAFVFSKLFYCSTVGQNIKKLKLVQNFVAKIVLGVKKKSTTSLKALNHLGGLV